MQQKVGQMSSVQKGDFEASAHVLGRMTSLSFVHENENEDADTVFSLLMACTINLHTDAQFLSLQVHVDLLLLLLHSLASATAIWLYITVRGPTEWAVSLTEACCREPASTT